MPSVGLKDTSVYVRSRQDVMKVTGGSHVPTFLVMYFGFLCLAGDTYLCMYDSWLRRVWFGFEACKQWSWGV